MINNSPLTTIICVGIVIFVYDLILKRVNNKRTICMKFHCSKCNNTVEVTKTTMTVKDGKIVYPETVCNCGYLMKDVTEFEGFGGIIKRAGGKVRGKR
tara:strand:- start:1592 stop:1885 length:294 start_codon:yes stop_codon:yes gene_type:complete